jgi:hypothetical protein
MVSAGLATSCHAVTGLCSGLAGLATAGHDCSESPIQVPAAGFPGDLDFLEIQADGCLLGRTTADTCAHAEHTSPSECSKGVPRVLHAPSGA